MLASISSATLLGAEGRPVTVEVHVGKGIPGFHMVGTPDDACRESRDRVRAAVMSSGEVWPDQRITVNLAPSGHRKIGAGLDLAIAIGVLVAAGRLPADAVDGHGFVGELGLDGSLRRVAGVAPMVGVLGDRTAVAPSACAAEARVAAGGGVHTAGHLRDVVGALAGEAAWPDDEPPSVIRPEVEPPDLADVRGQPVARRALEIAAAGGHHLLLVGPPGAGKTMLAQRLPGLLPALDRELALAVTMVHSAAAVTLPPGGLVRRAPFRAPHHTSSVVALVGGGSHALRPGEISLSHGGVLFLDELGEFSPTVLDGLREPLEEGVIRVARAALHAVLPARFLLVAATNPCPCGGGAPGSCSCDEGMTARYLRRLTGPLLDRFDLRVAVHRPAVDDLLASGGGEPTSIVAARVAQARGAALERCGFLNADLPARLLDDVAALAPGARCVLRAELERGRLTGRGYHRIRRVARTIADLQSAGAAVVEVEHVETALSLRSAIRTVASGRAA